MGLSFEVRGPDSAEPVLFSPGLGGAARFWAPQLVELATRFRVIAYDHRGAGDREILPDAYDIEFMVQDVIDVLDAAAPGKRIHFVGHALGGLVGLGVALAFPTRLASLTLVNAWATLPPHTARCFDARLAILAHGGPEAYLRAQSIFLYPAAWIADHEALVEREVELGLDHFQGAHNLCCRVEAIRKFDVGQRLGEIRTPTLVVAATDDLLVPVTRSEALRAIPRSRVWRCSGGHACTTTNSGVFNRTLQDFLSACQDSRNREQEHTGRPLDGSCPEIRTIETGNGG